MNKSILVVTITAVVPLLLFSAEPSAFGAGDLNNPEPYGLTSNEKVILETKQKLHKIAQKSNNQANEVDSLRERLDGLQSVIESLSRKSHNNKINLQKLQEQNTLKLQSSDEYERRLSEVVEANTQSINASKKVVSELSVLLEHINKDYVTKAEFNALIKDINRFKDLMAKELKSGSSKSSKSTKKSSADLYNEAKKLFDKRYYTKAIENYEILIKRNYKPAYAHYMIGEMNYRRKNYANALSYFKKSTHLYAKASYMPTLMLHSAISMDKTGDKKHARAFYEAIVAKYPNSKEAKEAKKYL
jgi:TolA-binding protein